ncbi:MAG: hypothetical protein ABEJ07_03395 [Candidatus Nanohaloarchaea archaeon]
MRVEKLLKRLKREFVKVNFLQAVLDSLLFFLSVNLVLFLLDVRLTPTFRNEVVIGTLSLVFLLLDMLYRTEKYRLEIYEEKNPQLEEVLRTARDNLDRQNIVSQALFDDLLDRARKVTSESIIPNKRIIQKILAVGVLSFLTVMSGITSFQLQQTSGELFPGVDEIQQRIQGEDQGFELKNSSKIYGEQSDIDSSDIDIGFNITGSGRSGDREAGPGKGQEQELRLDTSAQMLGEDMQLAKQYSLAIRELDNS